MTWEDLLEKAERIFEKEPRMISLPSEGKIVFVGDTHGDLEATRRIAKQYLKNPYRVVFLGDYVDRGEDSERNIEFLLGLKLDHPEGIFLLAGNHEGFGVKPFEPSDFWGSISPEKKKRYGVLFSKFPLAASAQNGILAVHGALPDLASLEEMSRIEAGDENWDRILWGDFAESEDDFLGDLWGRPRFGRPYFERMMERYRKQVLIRSHQPHAPLEMFNKRCVTIFTSHAYLATRIIALADAEKEIRSAEDMLFERL